MEVYNTEEEQVQAIKQWWKDNAFSLIAGVVIGFTVLGGYRYWTENKQNQAQQASVLYSEVLASTKDKVKITEMLKADYAGTPYAGLASLLIAKDNVNANEMGTPANILRLTLGDGLFSPDGRIFSYRIGGGGLGMFMWKARSAGKNEFVMVQDLVTGGVGAGAFTSKFTPKYISDNFNNITKEYGNNI